MRIGLAQINSYLGNFKQNRETILKWTALFGECGPLQNGFAILFEITEVRIDLSKADSHFIDLALKTPARTAPRSRWADPFAKSACSATDARCTCANGRPRSQGIPSSNSRCRCRNPRAT